MIEPFFLRLREKQQVQFSHIVNSSVIMDFYKTLTPDSFGSLWTETMLL